MMTKLVLMVVLIPSITELSLAQIPEYYSSPPIDNAIELFAVAVSQTEEAAFAIAMVELARKIERYKEEEGNNSSSINETSNETSTMVSNHVQNRELFRFNVRSLEKSYSEQSAEGKVLNQKYELAIKIRYSSNDECSLIIDHYITTNEIDGELEEETEGGVNWVNCSFSHAKRYMKENSELDYNSAEVNSLWYSLLSVKTSALSSDDE